MDMGRLCLKIQHIGLSALLALIGLGITSPKPTIAADLSVTLSAFAEPDHRVTLSLSEAVLQALENNLDIRVSQRTRDIRVSDIIFQQSSFDPNVEITGRFDRNISPLNRGLVGATTVVGGEVTTPRTFDQRIAQSSLGISQTVPTGMNYTLSLESQRTNVNQDLAGLFNPNYNSNFALDLTQPLLKNFGTSVNQTQIKIAQNNARVERHVFFNQVLDVIAEVEQTYWELVFARENLVVAEAALQAAKELLANNRARAEQGLMSEVDVLQARTGVASRQEEVLLAKKQIRDQEDQLRRLLTPSEYALRATVEVIPVDEPTETLPPLVLDEIIDIALKERPEVLQALKAIENSDLSVRFAKNQLMPSLDLEGTVGLNGLGTHPFSRLGNTTYYQWGAGLVLSYPIGNRSARSQYNKRRLEALNARTSLQSTRQGVIVNVKEAIRRVQTDFKRIETNRSARLLAEKQLNAEEARLNVGLTTTRVVLEFQRDLALARRDEFRAIVDFNKSLSNLAKSQAVTLDQYHITLQ